MLFKFPVALALALLTLGASASEHFIVTSLRRRDQPGDYPQNRGKVEEPADGVKLNLNEQFGVTYKPIYSGELIRTAAIQIEIEIPSLGYKHRLARNLAPPGFDKEIKENFFFLHPTGIRVKQGTSLPGFIKFSELQEGTKRNGNGDYFPVKEVQATFNF